MHRFILLGAVSCLAIGASAAQPADDCDAGAEAVREVRAVAEGIIAADNARDIERVLGYYADDAVLMPPGEQPVTGRDAIRPRYEQLFAQFNPEIEAHVLEACAGASFAFVRGQNGGRLVPRAGGNPRDLNDVYLMLLRRDAGAGWRISHLIWHPAESKPDR
jgi:uncharacterized protein (TIGR02246 family)